MWKISPTQSCSLLVIGPSSHNDFFQEFFLRLGACKYASDIWSLGTRCTYYRYAIYFPHVELSFFESVSFSVEIMFTKPIFWSNQCSLTYKVSSCTTLIVSNSHVLFIYMSWWLGLFKLMKIHQKQPMGLLDLILRQCHTPWNPIIIPSAHALPWHPWDKALNLKKLA